MINQFYGKPVELVRQVDEFSGNNLLLRDDLQRLFGSCLNEKNGPLFEEAIFTAKYVLGLMRVLKKGTENPDVENLDNIKSDLTENMKKIAAQIRELLSGSTDEDKNYFEVNFLQLSPDAFQNLNKLLADLDWTKRFFNDLKRN